MAWIKSDFPDVYHKNLFNVSKGMLIQKNVESNISSGSKNTKELEQHIISNHKTLSFLEWHMVE